VSVLFALPQYAGFAITHNMQSVCALARSLTTIGFAYDMTFGQDSAVHRNRTFLTQSFMESDHEMLMFIDSDIGFTTADFTALHALVASNHADVAVGCYRLKQEGSKLAAHHDGRLVSLETLPKKPFEVEYAGTGFMLIHRRAFEAIKHGLPVIDTIRGKIPRWWAFDIVDGVELPEDYSFCERVRGAGMRVVMDPSVILDHWGLACYN
jgi:hypothetical protein